MNTNKKRNNSFKINPTYQIFLAIGLFIAAVLASRSPVMPDWEIWLFHTIYGWPDALRPLFIFVTQFGSIYVLGLLLIFYMFHKKYHAVLRILLVGMLAYLLSGFAKDIWGRARPHEILIGIINKDYIVRGPGFPSGHVALAVALALSIGHYLPKKYHWIIYVWIIGVALSRIYLGIHAPLDIVGGFAIGWLSYALFRHVRLHDISLVRKSIKRS